MVTPQRLFKMKYYCLLLCLCLFTACLTKDTCFPLGDTFQDVVLQQATESAVLELNLITLDTLPAAYFEAAALVRLMNDQNGQPFNNLAESSTLEVTTADSLKISLPPPPDVLTSVGLSIRYPDRQDFVACEHAGSGDQYVLFLYFNYLPDGRIDEFRWVEDFRPGGF